MRHIFRRIERLEQKRLTTDEVAIVLGVGKSPQEVDDEVKRKAARLRPGVPVLIIDI